MNRRIARKILKRVIDTHGWVEVSLYDSACRAIAGHVVPWFDGSWSTVFMVLQKPLQKAGQKDVRDWRVQRFRTTKRFRIPKRYRTTTRNPNQETKA